MGVERHGVSDGLASIPAARWWASMMVVLVAFAVVTDARDLKPQTLKAYERYLDLTNQRLAAERSGASPFMWIDRQSPSAREAIMARLRSGEVVIDKMETRDNGKAIDAPDGLIHHWIGTVFLPNVPIDRVLAVVQAYDRYTKMLDPMIVRARLVNHADDHYVINMRTSVKKVITVVMDIDYVVDYHRISPTRVWTTNLATDIFQVDDAGTPSEKRTPADQSSGFLWRFWMACGFEGRPDGSLEQCESVTLTRSIPFGLAWFIKPFVTGIPRDTMEFTLSKIRATVLQ